MKIKLLKSAIIAASIAVSGIANAGLISYNTLTEYLTATSATNLINFNNQPSSGPSIGSSYTESGLVFTGNLRAGNGNVGAQYADGYLMSTGNINIDLLPNTVSFAFELGAYYGNATTLTATAFTSSGANLQFVTGTSTTFGFAGFSATNGDYITSVVTSQTSTSNYDAIDDVRWSVGAAPPRPDMNVPEPSTFAIFALGIMGLASRRFKKQS